MHHTRVMCVRGGLSDGHAPIHPLDLQDIKELEVRARMPADVDVLVHRLRDVDIRSVPYEVC